MSIDEIVRHIHEFYLVLMGEHVVWCYRLFSPDSAKDVYELGSVVSKEKGIWTIIASQAVGFARINKKKVIVITDNPGLMKILTEGNWRKATGQFPKRSKLSAPWKDIYLHSGNIESPSLFS
jgi:predicted GNAT family N-acyltransferase